MKVSRKNNKMLENAKKYKDNKEYDKAISLYVNFLKDFKKSKKLSQEFVPIYDALAFCYMNTGDLDQSKITYQMILDIGQKANDSKIIKYANKKLLIFKFIKFISWPFKILSLPFKKLFHKK